MKKTLFFALLFSLTLHGCSGEYVSAKYHIARADEAFYNAYKLRTKKRADQKRLEYYRDACSHFKEAYQRGSKTFTLYNIDSAVEACARIDDLESKNMFQKFQEQYIQEHPVEAEHGDAGVELLVAE